MAVNVAGGSSAKPAGPGDRARLLAAAFLLPLAAVGARVAVIQTTCGDAVAAAHDAPRPREEAVPAAGGRVLAADGAVWAWDEPRFEVSVHYRRLQAEPDPGWLAGRVRSVLSRADRRDPAKVSAAEGAVRAERDAVRVRLAAACGLSVGEIDRRFAAVERRVSAMKAKVLSARVAKKEERDAERAAAADDSFLGRIAAELTTPPDRGGDRDDTLAEEVAYHRVAGGLGARAAMAIEGAADRFPGVRVEPVVGRRYAAGLPAPHLVGLRSGGGTGGEGGTGTGLSGVEAAFDGVLTHRPGSRRLWEDRRGEVVRTEVLRPAVRGRDVRLTVDPRLQAFAAARLALALKGEPGRPTPTGGAVVLMDVHSGAILAAASGPTFDPAALSDPEAWATLRSDPRAPLLDRVTAAAVPPGSVFKPVIVAAALEEGVLYGDGSLDCRGYLDRPDRHRCACFVSDEVGHGFVGPAGALCRSCNVWCFDAADRLGADAVRRWAGRFGFGERTGVGLPGERGGSTLPGGDVSRDLLLESGVGQGRVTATPLQICRMTCAVVNGGRLVVPRVVAGSGGVERGRAHAKPRAVGLTEETLRSLRTGMDGAVNDPSGTAYRHARSKRLRIAGKTGTAQVGGGRPSHAWFTGYAPAGAPRVAVCVLLEHGGSGGRDAGPVGRDVLEAWADGRDGRARVDAHAKPQAKAEPFRVRRVR